MNLSDKIFNKEIIKKIYIKLKSDKKTFLILLVGLAGMVVIMLTPSDEKFDKKDDKSVVHNLSYENIQNDVKVIIESIKGAGKTVVYITYESDSENVYAINTDEKTDGSDVHIKSEYVITDDENAVILKVKYPKVKGVAVVCEGGNDPIVKEKIYAVVSALFDISTNKISIADMA